MWRSIASNALTILIVILVGAGITVAAAKRSYEGPGPLTDAACVAVPRGATMASVSETLDGMGAVRSALLFRLGADYSGKAQDLKAGNFLIGPEASMREVVDAITRGGQSTCGADINLRVGVASLDIQVREMDPATGQFDLVAQYDPADDTPPEVQVILDQGFARTRVTVAEGVTVWQILDSLQKASFLSGAAGDKPDEGTLAPGSYDVQIGSARAALVTRMREAQEDIIAAAWAGRDRDVPVGDVAEALTLASIIEKETAVPEERRLVASVFVNRLNEGMRLQTDPTVIYGITGGEGVLGRGLYRSELARPTPWNTYTHAGLPPTPIANPGLESIEAALHPAETGYLYFVADGTGGHVFAETLAEHNQNVRRWRQIEAERAGQ
ncbi:MAG: endolytic transglycosylase MltG [Qingshengfaniella sp.]